MHEIPSYNENKFNDIGLSLDLLQSMDLLQNSKTLNSAKLLRRTHFHILNS